MSELPTYKSFPQFLADMTAAGWKRERRRAKSYVWPFYHVWTRDGHKPVKSRYVYLAYVRTGRLPEWAK